MSKLERDKGRRGEYEVRDILKDITGVPWMRTPLSGGLHLSFPWDVMPVHVLPSTSPLAKTGVEVKNCAVLKLPKWIAQCEEAEIDYLGFPKGDWLLFFKRTQWYVVMPVEQLKRLLQHG